MRSLLLASSTALLPLLAHALPAAPEPRASPLATVYSSCTKPNTVALTFDDGPYIYIQNIVDKLDAAGVKGTFFLNGNNYDCIYSSARVSGVQYAYNRGHMIGSHTWSHGDLTSFSTAQITDGMYRVEEALARIIGVKPGFMRPPFGSYNDATRQVAYARNQSFRDRYHFYKERQFGCCTRGLEAKLLSELPASTSTDKRSSTVSRIDFPIGAPDSNPKRGESRLRRGPSPLRSTGQALSELASSCPSMAPPRVASIMTPPLGLWDLDTEDSLGASVADSEKVYRDAVNQGLSTMLVLNHEPIETTADQVVPYALNLLINAGYDLVTLAECVGKAPYAAIGTPQSRTSAWTCDGSPDPGAGCSGSQCRSGTPPLSGGGGSNPTTTTTKKTTTTTKPPSTSTSKSATTTTTSTPPSGSGQLIKPYASSSRCLTAASNADGAAVTIQPCTSSSSQLWTYTGAVGGASGALKVFGGKCLDVTDGSTAGGTPMQIYGCGSGGVGNANQQWSVTTDNRIAWTDEHECLTLPGGTTTSGTVTQVSHCTSGANTQVWYFS